MRFTAPYWLVLLASVVWFWRARSSRSAWVVWVRCTAAALFVLAAAGLQVWGGSSPLSVMFVLDRSSSMGDEADSARALAALTADMREDDRAGLVVFGADASVERRLAPGFELTRIASATSSVGTNIERALRLARTAASGDNAVRIVLMSDGQETAGRALDEASRAAAAGIPVDAVSPPDRGVPNRPMIVSRLSAPPAVRTGESFTIVATVTGAPGERGEVQLSSDSGSVGTEQMTMTADGVAAIPFTVSADRSGVHTYRAAAHSPRDDLGTATDQAGVVVVASGVPRILHVGDGPLALAAALENDSFQVSRAPGGSLPASAAALARYDGVILDDVSPDALNDNQAAALHTYVESMGGGLLVLGSPRSLEPGLSPDSPMGRLLPIDLRPRSGGRARGVALVVVFDKSGSMDDRVNGAPRIEFAREAIGRVMESVRGSDAVGIIAFDAEPRTVAPLSTGHSASDVATRLRGIQPDGSTAIAPALERAAEWLRGPEAARAESRHVLLVSDGRTSAADAARAQAVAARGGFELTAVALGGDSDRQFLTQLSASTGARAFFPDDIRDLPAILAREAARVSGGGVVEESFVARAYTHPIVAGLDTSTLPRLGGYVVSATKASSTAALVSHLDDPILATGRVGLGKVAVYTADVSSDWSTGLRSWRGFAPLFSNTLRWVGRNANHGDLYVRLSETDGGLALHVEAPLPDGSGRALLDTHASVRSPSGLTTDVALRETAPGQYDATAPIAEPGPYIVAVTATSRDGAFNAGAVRGLYSSGEREHQRTGINRALLTSLADATGGRVLSAGEDPFSAPRPSRHHDTRPWLALAALAFFLCDIFGPGIASSVRALKKRRAGNAPDDFMEAA